MQSIMFLIEVSEFNDALEAATADNDTVENLERFQAVVKKYVKDGAPFEINIGFKTKAAILEAVAAENRPNIKLVRQRCASPVDV